MSECMSRTTAVAVLAQGPTGNNILTPGFWILFS